MDPSINASLNLLNNGNYLFGRALEGLEPEHLHKRPGEANPLIWILGHLTYCRVGILNLTGLKREMPWADLFARATSITDPDTYPALDEIVKAWEGVSEDLRDRLSELTEEQLDADCPRRLPVGDPSLRTGVAFMFWHEAYHLGQAAYIRKWLGLGRLIDDR